MRHYSTAVLLTLLLGVQNVSTAADQPASTGRMIAIEVVIAQFADALKDGDAKLDSDEKIIARVLELEKKGQLGRFTRVRLTTLDQNPAMLQSGERTPIATSRTRAAEFGRGNQNPQAGGQMSTAYSYENVGTLINVVPQIHDDSTIGLKLELEQSYIDPVAPAEADASEPPPSRSKTMRNHNTLRVRSGETALVGQFQTAEKAESGQTVVLITAKASDSPARARTAQTPVEQAPVERASAEHAPAELQLQTFSLENRKAEELSGLVRGLFKSKEIEVEAIAASNSLVVRGTPAILADVKDILQKLDTQRPR